MKKLEPENSHPIKKIMIPCAQLVHFGNQLLGPNTQLQWEMTFQLKSRQPDVPEVSNLNHMQHMLPWHW